MIQGRCGQSSASLSNLSFMLHSPEREFGSGCETVKPLIARPPGDAANLWR
jgi:hypothetical protein